MTTDTTDTTSTTPRRGIGMHVGVEDKSSIAAGVRSLKGNAYDAAAAGARVLGYEDKAQELENEALNEHEAASALRPNAPTFSEVLEKPTLRGIGSFIGNTVGEQLPLIAAGVISGGVGALGARGVAAAAARNAAARKAATTVGGAAGGTAPIASATIGETHSRLRHEAPDMDPRERAATAIASGAAQVPLEYMPISRGLKRMTGNGISGNRLKRTLQGGATSMVEEGATEAAQNLLQDATVKYANPEADVFNLRDTIDAAGAGGALGLILGGLGGAMSKRRRTSRRFDLEAKDIVQEAKKKGTDPRESLKKYIEENRDQTDYTREELDTLYNTVLAEPKRSEIEEEMDRIELDESQDQFVPELQKELDWLAQVGPSYEYEGPSFNAKDVQIHMRDMVKALVDAAEEGKTYSMDDLFGLDRVIAENMPETLANEIRTEFSKRRKAEREGMDLSGQELERGVDTEGDNTVDEPDGLSVDEEYNFFSDLVRKSTPIYKQGGGWFVSQGAARERASLEDDGIEVSMYDYVKAVATTENVNFNEVLKETVEEGVKQLTKKQQKDYEAQHAKQNEIEDYDEWLAKTKFFNVSSMRPEDVDPLLIPRERLFDDDGKGNPLIETTGGPNVDRSTHLFFNLDKGNGPKPQTVNLVSLRNEMHYRYPWDNSLSSAENFYRQLAAGLVGLQMRIEETKTSKSTQNKTGKKNWSADILNKDLYKGHIQFAGQKIELKELFKYAQKMASMDADGAVGGPLKGDIRKDMPKAFWRTMELKNGRRQRITKDADEQGAMTDEEKEMVGDGGTYKQKSEKLIRHEDGSFEVVLEDDIKDAPDDNVDLDIQRFGSDSKGEFSSPATWKPKPRDKEQAAKRGAPEPQPEEKSGFGVRGVKSREQLERQGKAAKRKEENRNKREASPKQIEEREKKIFELNQSLEHVRAEALKQEPGSKRRAELIAQGIGIQENIQIEEYILRLAKETARERNYKGKPMPMKYEAENSELRADLRGKYPNGATMLALIQNGDRMATTRNVPKGINVGTVFEIDGIEGQKFIVTAIERVDMKTQKGRKKWEAREGWSIDAAGRKFPKQVYHGAKQIVFKPYTEKTDFQYEYIKALGILNRAQQSLSEARGLVEFKKSVTLSEYVKNKQIQGLVSQLSELSKQYRAVLAMNRDQQQDFFRSPDLQKQFLETELTRIKTRMNRINRHIGLLKNTTTLDGIKQRLDKLKGFGRTMENAKNPSYVPILKEHNKMWSDTLFLRDITELKIERAEKAEKLIPSLEREVKEAEKAVERAKEDKEKHDKKELEQGKATIRKRALATKIDKVQKQYVALLENYFSGSFVGPLQSDSRISFDAMVSLAEEIESLKAEPPVAASTGNSSGFPSSPVHGTQKEYERVAAKKAEKAAEEYDKNAPAPEPDAETKARHKYEAEQRAKQDALQDTGVARTKRNQKGAKEEDRRARRQARREGKKIRDRLNYAAEYASIEAQSRADKRREEAKQRVDDKAAVAYNRHVLANRTYAQAMSAYYMMTNNQIKQLQKIEQEAEDMYVGEPGVGKTAKETEKRVKDFLRARIQMTKLAEKGKRGQRALELMKEISVLDAKIKAIKLEIKQQVLSDFAHVRDHMTDTEIRSLINNVFRNRDEAMELYDAREKVLQEAYINSLPTEQEDKVRAGVESTRDKFNEMKKLAGELTLEGLDPLEAMIQLEHLTDEYIDSGYHSIWERPEVLEDIMERYGIEESELIYYVDRFIDEHYNNAGAYFANEASENFPDLTTNLKRALSDHFAYEQATKALENIRNEFYVRHKEDFTKHPRAIEVYMQRISNTLMITEGDKANRVDIHLNFVRDLFRNMNNDVWKQKEKNRRKYRMEHDLDKLEQSGLKKWVELELAMLDTKDHQQVLNLMHKHFYRSGAFDPFWPVPDYKAVMAARKNWKPEHQTGQDIGGENTILDRKENEGLNRRMQGLARTWVKALGIRDPNKVKIISGEQAIKRLKEAGRDPDTYKSAGTMFPQPDGTYEIFLNYSGNMSGMIETLAHEVGHILMAEMIGNVTKASGYKELTVTEDGKTKTYMIDDIVDFMENKVPKNQHKNQHIAFQLVYEHHKWLKAHNLNGNSYLKDVLRNRTARNLLEHAGIQRSLEKLSEENVAYMLSFNEWFADNVSRWLTTQKAPRTAIESFFEEIADMLRRLFIKAGLVSKKENANTVVSRYLKQQYRGSKEGPKDLAATRFEISYREAKRSLYRLFTPEKMPKKPKLKSLAEFVAENGGIDKASLNGELENAKGRKFKGKLAVKSRNGKVLGEMVLAAYQEGYIREDDENMFLDKMNNELSGDPVYTADDAMLMAEYERGVMETEQYNLEEAVAFQKRIDYVMRRATQEEIIPLKSKKAFNDLYNKIRGENRLLQDNFKPKEPVPWNTETMRKVQDSLRQSLGKTVGVEGVYDEEETSKYIFLAGALQMNPEGDAARAGIKYAIEHGKFFKSEERNTLELAATRGSIRRQLLNLLRHDPDALEEIKDPAMAVAYAYQFWSAGQLDPTKTVDSLFQRFLNKMREILGIVTAEENTAEIFARFKEGEFADRMNNGDQFTIVRQKTDTQVQRLFKATAEMSKPLRDLYSTVLSTAAEQIDRSGNAQLIALRKAIVNRTNAEGEDEGMIASRNRIIGEFDSEFAKIFTDEKMQNDAEFGERVTKIMLGFKGFKAENDVEERVVKRLRALMKRAFMYGRGTGIGMRFEGNEEEHYFPRVFDTVLLENDRDGFIKRLTNNDDQERQQKYDAALREMKYGFKEENGKKVLGGQPLTMQEKVEMATIILDTYVKHYGDSETTADELMREIRDGKEDINELGAPFAASTKMRTFGWIHQEDVAPYLHTDMELTMTKYFSQMVKKGEFVRRFGVDGAGNAKRGRRSIQSYLDEALKTGATATEVEKAKKLAEAAMGRLNVKDLDPNFQKLQGWMMVIQNYALLGLATLTSLVDPIGIAVRGDWDTATVAMKAGMKEVAAGLRQEGKTSRRLFGEMLGTVDRSTTIEALGQQYGGYHVTGAARQANDFLFKINMLEGWTNLTRNIATTAGIHFIRKHHLEPNESSQRYLDELGLKEGDVDASQDDLGILSNEERAELYKEQEQRAFYLKAGMWEGAEKLSEYRKSLTYNEDTGRLDYRVVHSVFKSIPWKKAPPELVQKEIAHRENMLNGAGAYLPDEAIEMIGNELQHLRSLPDAADIRMGDKDLSEATRKWRDEHKNRIKEIKDRLRKDSRVRAAVNRFVDEAILRPDSSQRPLWGSDPRFMLVMHLKSFTFSFQERILRRVYYEVLEGNYNPLLALGAYIPAAFVSMTIKGLLQGDWDDDDDDTLVGTIFESAERGGLLGTAQFAYDAVMDIQRGGVGLRRFAGPTLDHTLQFGSALLQFDGDLNDEGKAALRGMPGFVIWKDWFKGE